MIRGSKPEFQRNGAMVEDFGSDTSTSSRACLQGVVTMTSSDATIYRFGSFALDLEQEALLEGDGNEKALRPKSFALLRLLVENTGRLLSHETIMEAIWPDVFVTENNITQCVHDIRRALGPHAHLLRTRPRRGYVFTSDA